MNRFHPLATDMMMYLEKDENNLLVTGVVSFVPEIDNSTNHLAGLLHCYALCDLGLDAGPF
jgi:hypothetical protein